MGVIGAVWRWVVGASVGTGKQSGIVCSRSGRSGGPANSVWGSLWSGGGGGGGGGGMVVIEVVEVW